jgi:hypothetical protein
MVELELTVDFGGESYVELAWGIRKEVAKLL